MSRRALLALSAPLLILLVSGALIGPNAYATIQRANQKRTMADMAAAWKQIEKGRPPSFRNDGWEHPMEFRLAGSHRMIRAAVRDGKFEPLSTQVRATTGWDADIVLVEGRFVQFPDGICAGDEPGKGILGDCASCHPRHITK